MNRIIFFITAAIASFALTGHGADTSLITKLRVKTIAPRTFLCTKQELKIEEVPTFIRGAITPLIEAATELKLGSTGPLLMSYLGYRGDRSVQFTAELAIPAPQRTETQKGRFYFRSAEPFKCASVIFQGPVKNLGEAWRSLVEQATEADLKATGNSRELYLWWEGEDSESNVIELQLGLE